MNVLEIASDPFPEIKIPRDILEPIAMHGSGRYNAWRANNPRSIPYVEALARLSKLLR